MGKGWGLGASGWGLGASGLGKGGDWVLVNGEGMGTGW